MDNKKIKKASPIDGNLVSQENRRDSKRFSRDRYVSRPSVDNLKSDDKKSGASDDASKYKNIVKNRKKKKKIKIVLISLLAVILIGVGTAFGWMAYLNSSMNSKVDDSLKNALKGTDSPSDPFYMLLLGIDGSIERGGDGTSSYRCDSIILTRVDPKTKQVTLVSLPRDLQITNMGGTSSNPSGYGTQKLNAAHAYGGPALVVETISKIANVPISHYVEINFDGFIAAVDGVGGVEVDVAYPINDPYTGWSVPAGKSTINGYQALSLCRSRHTYDNLGDGDALRTANQRMVLSALASKILKSDVATILNTVNNLVQYVLTDMDVASIVGIAQNLQGLDASKIYTGSMPKTSKLVDGVWYDFVYADQWKEMMSRVDSGLSPSAEDVVDAATGIVISKGDGSSGGSGDKPKNATASIAVRNGSGAQGVSTKAVEKLKSFGYTNVEAGNADSFDYKQTLIVYKDEKYKADAEMIAAQLGVGSATADDGNYIMTGNLLVILGADYSG